MKKSLISKSKFLSLILRHSPEEIGLTLDGAGWAPVDAILANSRQPITHEELLEIVETNPKQRFALSEDGRSIRARQGHSRDVDLGLKPVTPPSILYHGTAAATRVQILAEGLRPMGRHHVHLSADKETARTVGARHGKPVILQVAASALHQQGQAFYLSENGVWLTGPVAPEALSE
ncbi:RNA 2'-phosphotransferase [Thalassovita sp.]|uniref:RNA 2'-phosphotransferase n=1 Tax=Thalassovita sp. TaxID=1979401 RepID=UPI002AB1D8C2|nr:RNA 2'-phosphotransferase [Thalassovita sp.]